MLQDAGQGLPLGPLVRLCSSHAGDTGSMPVRRTKIPHAAQCSQKLKNKKQARIHPSKRGQSESCGKRLYKVLPTDISKKIDSLVQCSEVTCLKQLSGVLAG